MAKFRGSCWEIAVNLWKRQFGCDLISLVNKKLEAPPKLRQLGLQKFVHWNDIWFCGRRRSMFWVESTSYYPGTLHQKHVYSSLTQVVELAQNGSIKLQAPDRQFRPEGRPHWIVIWSNLPSKRLPWARIWQTLESNAGKSGVRFYMTSVIRICKLYPHVPLGIPKNGLFK